MRTKKIILLALAAILATLSKGEEIEYFDLTEAQKQLIPYEKGQVISFIDGVGETIDVTVIRSELLWLKYEEDDTYIMYRRKSATLKSEPDNFEIDLFIEAEYAYLSENYFDWFCIDMKPDTLDRWCYFFYSDKEKNLPSDHPSYIIETHKNLEINGKVYYDVMEQKYTGTFCDERGRLYEMSFHLFYNKTYGILQVDRDGRNFLTIVPETDEDKGNNSPDMIDCFGTPLAERNVK